MAHPKPGDEITVAIPTYSGKTRRIRGTYLHDYKDGSLTIWAPDSRRSPARFMSARPEWVETVHRKMLLPEPTKLLEQEGWST